MQVRWYRCLLFSLLPPNSRLVATMSNELVYTVDHNHFRSSVPSSTYYFAAAIIDVTLLALTFLHTSMHTCTHAHTSQIQVKRLYCVLFGIFLLIRLILLVLKTYTAKDFCCCINHALKRRRWRRRISPYKYYHSLDFSSSIHSLNLWYEYIWSMQQQW